jgi:hypothetical protein
MPDRINGSAKAQFNSSVESLGHFKMYASSPKAVTYPEDATGIYILTTGSIQDESQKNFELLLQSIALRSMPYVMMEPKVTVDLKLMGSPTLDGEGFIWEFAVEDEYSFEDDSDPVGLLIKELHGIVLPNGSVINTVGENKNVEFIKVNK